MTAEALRDITLQARERNLKALIDGIKLAMQKAAALGFMTTDVDVSAEEFKRILGKMDVPEAIKLVNNILFPAMGEGIECMIAQRGAEHFILRFNWSSK